MYGDKDPRKKKGGKKRNTFISKKILFTCICVYIYIFILIFSRHGSIRKNQFFLKQKEGFGFKKEGFMS